MARRDGFLDAYEADRNRSKELEEITAEAAKRTRVRKSDGMAE